MALDDPWFTSSFRFRSISYILKTQSNFTLFLYVFRFDRNEICHCFCMTCPKRTQKRWFMQVIRYRVICTPNFSIFCSKPWFWTKNWKSLWLSIKSPAKHFVFFLWLTNDSHLKFLHVEIISLRIKTLINSKNPISDNFSRISSVICLDLYRKYMTKSAYKNPMMLKENGRRCPMGFPLKALLSLINRTFW